jgi:hypothetical protein
MCLGNSAGTKRLPDPVSNRHFNGSSNPWTGSRADRSQDGRLLPTPGGTREQCQCDVSDGSVQKLLSIAGNLVGSTAEDLEEDKAG